MVVLRADGPKAIRDCHWDIIKTEFSKVQGAKVRSLPLLRPVCQPDTFRAQYYFVDDLQEKSLLHYRDLTMQGIPNNHELQWLSWRGPGYAHLFFAPISPSRGKDAETQYELCKQLCRKYEFQYMGNFCACCFPPLKVGCGASTDAYEQVSARARCTTSSI